MVIRTIPIPGMTMQRVFHAEILQPFKIASAIRQKAMEEKELKYIIGQALENRPAVIRFYGPVTSETTAAFNNEFLWLQNCIRPSKILVLINSEGGSVIAGMSTFSVIQSCPIETHCVIEGIAASMGSVIWAAGSKLFMHDYSILMIHNPFVEEGSDDEDTKRMLKAFRGQLETIYHKRFGLPVTKVREIMDGGENVDGTYLTAKEAVAAGILPASNVIKTSEQVRADIKSKLEGVESATSIRDIMSMIADDAAENKLIEKTLAILEQNKQNNQSQPTMNEKELTFDSVKGQLGLAADSPVASVPARVAELIKAETELADAKTALAKAQAELDQLKIQHKGKEAEVKNLTDELASTKEQLKGYQDAEAAAKEANIQNIVEAAVKDGKISADSKDEWIAMARTNLAMVEKTLAGIQAREVISDAIAQDPANAAAAAASMKTSEEVIEAKLNAAIGSKFEFKKFQ